MNVELRSPASRTVLPGAESLLAFRSLERRRLQCYLGFMVGDIATLFACFAFSGWMYLGPEGANTGLLLAQLVLPAFLTIAFYNEAYSMRSLQDWEYGAARGVIALCLSAAVVLFIAFYTRSANEFSRVVFTLSVILTGLVLVWGRAQLRALVRWRCGVHVINELVIDDGGPTLGLPGVRHVDAARHGLVPELSDPMALDRIGMILRNVDRVVVSCPPARRVAWAWLLKGANIEGEVIDDTVIELGAKGARQAGGRGLLLVSLGPLHLRSRAVKRIFDLVVAGSVLVLTAPLLALVAMAIVMEDGGPALFVQRRMGRGNTLFSMYKFRSMTIDRLDPDGLCSTERGDSRITRVGRFIRRTSIDELPQLLNVLLGDMSTPGGRSSSWRWTAIVPSCLGASAGLRKPRRSGWRRAVLHTVPASWREALAPVLQAPAAHRLGEFLSGEEAAGKAIFPPRDQRLAALALTPLEAVKVVILGQDPYHGPGQAHGLSFSVPPGTRVPPSLRNIYKELASDLGIAPAQHGNLEKWARQGVLLLNASLTVEAGRAGSHAGRGWEAITDAAIAAVARKREPCVFMLWGNHAKQKALAVPGLAHSHHLVLTAPHPSPLSAYAGFLGCRHFSQANEFLERNGRGAIDWTP